MHKAGGFNILQKEAYVFEEKWCKRQKAYHNTDLQGV